MSDKEQDTNDTTAEGADQTDVNQAMENAEVVDS
jgi:hypothetical protein